MADLSALDVALLSNSLFSPQQQQQTPVNTSGWTGWTNALLNSNQNTQNNQLMKTLMMASLLKQSQNQPQGQTRMGLTVPGTVQILSGQPNTTPNTANPTNATSPNTTAAPSSTATPVSATPAAKSAAMAPTSFFTSVSTDKTQLGSGADIMSAITRDASDAGINTAFDKGGLPDVLTGLMRQKFLLMSPDERKSMALRGLMEAQGYLDKIPSN